MLLLLVWGGLHLFSQDAATRKPGRRGSFIKCLNRREKGSRKMKGAPILYLSGIDRTVEEIPLGTPGKRAPSAGPWGLKNLLALVPLPR